MRKRTGGSPLELGSPYRAPSCRSHSASANYGTPTPAPRNERGNNSDSTAADQIGRFRAAVEETASFERARSPAGALFQIALAQQAAGDLASRIPDGDKFTDPTYQKLLRLLDSAALVLRDACAAADFRAVKDVVGVYIGIDWPDFDPPFQWRENIRQLAKEYRRSKEASTIAA
jgi:hypothetical protein